MVVMVWWSFGDGGDGVVVWWYGRGVVVVMVW